MHRHFSRKNLGQQWNLDKKEDAFIRRYKGENRLRCAVLLKFFQTEGRFPETFDEISRKCLVELSQTLDIDISEIGSYDPQSGTSIRHRADVREFLGFRPCRTEDYTRLQDWLINEVIQGPEDEAVLFDHAREWLWYNKIEPPAWGQQERIIKSALANFEEWLFQNITNALSDYSIQAIDRLFTPKATDETDRTTAIFSLLKSDPGKPGLNSVLTELSKLAEIDALNLPSGLFDGVSPKTLGLYRSRAATESIRDMRRRPDHIRYTLTAAFCRERRQEIIDGLIELLIQVVHKIQVRAEKKVIKELVGSIREVSGKKTTLFKIAEAAVKNPDGTIRDVLFPVVGEKILQDLVKEYYANSPVYTKKVETNARNSYKSHYRRMVPPILGALKFQSGNEYHQPVIEALDYLRAQKPSQRIIPVDDVPIDGIVPKSLYPFLIEEGSKGREHINRISYEICVLRALRNGLRCREIWVDGADRYRNPDEDVPQDFDNKRKNYYEDLNLPLDVNKFIGNLQEKMKEALSSFNANLPSNRKVSLRLQGKDIINLSPLDPQPAPKFLQNLKAEVTARWPMTSLLDIIKEAELQTGFTEEFRGLGDREILDRNTLQRRLLLCLYALWNEYRLKACPCGWKRFDL